LGGVVGWEEWVVVNQFQVYNYKGPTTYPWSALRIQSWARLLWSATVALLEYHRATPQQESTCLTPRSVPERSAGRLLAREVRKTSLRAAAKWPKRLCLSSAPVLKVNLK